MSNAILGKKIGMTSVFADNGNVVNVTVILAGPCPVLAVGEKYIQIGFDAAKESSLKKPLLGIFKKLNIPAQKKIAQVEKGSDKQYSIGDLVKVDCFAPGDFVDCIGTSKGKGFQGGMRRWNWSGGPQTHGSTSRRRIGSIGSTTSPGRVFKGHHLAGHMGDCRYTAQNLKVVKIDTATNIMMVEGAVSGYNNGYVMIRKAKKKQGRKHTTTALDKKENK